MYIMAQRQHIVCGWVWGAVIKVRGEVVFGVLDQIRSIVQVIEGIQIVVDGMIPESFEA
jgi:hypothetical protein